MTSMRALRSAHLSSVFAITRAIPSATAALPRGALRAAVTRSVSLCSVRGCIPLLPLATLLSSPKMTFKDTAARLLADARGLLAA